MNFISRVKLFSQMVFSTSRHWQWLLPRTSYNYARDVGDGLRSSVLVAVLFWVMRRFAEADMIIKVDDEVERDHALLDLWHRPNQYYSGRLLRMALSLSYKTDGNAYALKIRNNQLKPTELWYVPHWMMEPHWPPGGAEYIDYYNYNPQGFPIKVDPEDVIHIRFGLDPNNTRKGLAPLKSLVREVFTDDEAANFTASLLRNFGIPGLVISPGTDEAEMEKGTPGTIKEFFKAKTGDSRGEPLVMKRKTEVKQFGFNPQEMDLGRLREIPEERVCAVIGVHAAVVGLGTGMQQTKVGATMKELRESAYEDCIIPMQNTFAEELDTQLLPDFETDIKRYHVGFDLSDIRVLQEDENKHAERVTKLTESSLITIGEARAELGYEVRPEHDAYMRRFNMLVIPAAALLSEPEPKPIDVSGNGEDKALGFKLFSIFSPTTQLKIEAWQVNLVQAFYKDWQHLSTIWAKELTRDFKRLGREARKAWQKIVEEQGIDLAKQSAETKVDLDNLYAELIAEQIKTTDYAQYQHHFIRVGKTTYDTIESVLGLGINMSAPAESVIASAGGTKRGLLDLDKQTKEAVHKAIAEARAAGEGALKAGMNIETFVAAGPWSTPEIRGAVIGRTETKFAQNLSSLQAYKAGGFDNVTIVDGQIDTSCDMCIARDETVMLLDEAFGLYEHPNGTLSWTPVMEAPPA